MGSVASDTRSIMLASLGLTAAGFGGLTASRLGNLDASRKNEGVSLCLLYCCYSASNTLKTQGIASIWASNLKRLCSSNLLAAQEKQYHVHCFRYDWGSEVIAIRCCRNQHIESGICQHRAASLAKKKSVRLGYRVLSLAGAGEWVHRASSCDRSGSAMRLEGSSLVMLRSTTLRQL